jgi:hypothetical protein
MKIIVFDLDETLGYFTQFGIFWDCLNAYFNKANDTLSQSDFNNVLDLYPEFLRPNIIDVLFYLKDKKLTNCCNKIMIYTNNQGPKEWCEHIINYFNNKINYKLFDQIIAAFKVNGEKVELCRTTHNKTHTDLIKCTQIPSNAQICFLDDKYHHEMTNEHIYYINVKPYYHDLPFEVMMERFKKSKLYNHHDANFESSMMNSIKKYHYDCTIKPANEHSIDVIVSKQMAIHLKLFLRKKPSETALKTTYTKNKKIKKNKTRKIAK